MTPPASSLHSCQRPKASLLPSFLRSAGRVVACMYVMCCHRTQRRDATGVVHSLTTNRDYVTAKCRWLLRGCLPPAPAVRPSVRSTRSFVAPACAVPPLFIPCESQPARAPLVESRRRTAISLMLGSAWDNTLDEPLQCARFAPLHQPPPR